LTKNFGLKAFKFNYLKIIKMLLSRKDRLFFKRVIGNKLLNKVVNRNSLSTALIPLALKKFEMNKAKSFSQR
jgi:hypothetical protein